MKLGDKENDEGIKLYFQHIIETQDLLWNLGKSWNVWLISDMLKSLFICKTQCKYNVPICHLNLDQIPTSQMILVENIINIRDKYKLLEIRDTTVKDILICPQNREILNT